MRRQLFTLAAAVSAVLCVGVCVLWVRGYKVPDSLSWVRGGDQYTLVSDGPDYTARAAAVGAGVSQSIG
jgi:hypothetical protein